MAGNVFLRSIAALGAVFAYAEFAGGMPLADVLLIVLVSVLFISIGSSKGEAGGEKPTWHESEAQMKGQEIVIRGFDKQPLPG
jgi:hypothetical protein